MSDESPKEPGPENPPPEEDEEDGYGLAPATEETAPVAVPIEGEVSAELTLEPATEALSPQIQREPEPGLGDEEPTRTAEVDGDGQRRTRREKEEERELERMREREEIQPGPLPSLRPLRPLAILLWPLQGRNATGFIGHALYLVPLFIAGWLVDGVPVVGTLLRTACQLTAAIYAGFYLWRVVLASLESRRGPPEWVKLNRDNESLPESLRVAWLLLLHLLPAIFIGLAIPVGSEESPAPGGTVLLLTLIRLGVGVAAWGLFPAALLLLASGGSLRYAHPAAALRTARAGAGTYLCIVAPGALLLVGRLLAGGAWWGVPLEALALPVLVYTALLLGCLARENEEVSVQLFRIAELTKELETAEAEEE